MNKLAASCAALAIGLAASNAVFGADGALTNTIPSFEDYRVVVHHEPLTMTSLILQSKLARKNRTVIAQQAREPANYAGHYRVAIWGCGTDCRGFAIINKLDGRVDTMPGLEYVAGVTGNAEDRLAYRLDSRLFVITGRRNDEDEGKFYYLWNGNALKLILRTEITKESFDD